MQFEERQLLRMYVGEQAKHHHRPFYEAVIAEAKERGLAGATVYKGILSYGMSGTVHTTKILELSQSLPIVIEIMDTEERIEEFLPTVERLAAESGTHVHVTLEEVRSTVILPEK
ncbi:MAG: DUF190 domain-containing protein [Chlorobiales bacterium]|nr:DUF190 domain-containing protein [Chlorobiales bacterium]